MGKLTGKRGFPGGEHLNERRAFATAPPAMRPGYSAGPFICRVPSGGPRAAIKVDGQRAYRCWGRRRGTPVEKTAARPGANRPVRNCCRTPPRPS